MRSPNSPNNTYYITSAKLGGNLGAMISTKPEPVNIITLGNPITVMQIWSKLYQI